MKRLFLLELELGWRRTINDLKTTSIQNTSKVNGYDIIIKYYE